MGTECVSTVLNNHDSDPAIPPGFGPFISNSASNPASYSACDNSNSVSGNENNRKSRRNRRSVDYSQFDTCSEESPQKDLPSARNLPKGVLRGCAQCANCQKVMARWKPESSCRPALDEAPVFYPTEEEFKDTLKYIETIRPLAEPYGICRIVPPWTWRPPCILKQDNIWQNSKFSTRIQRVDKLQNRESAKKNTACNKRRKMNNGNEEGQFGNFDESCCNVERFGFEPGPEFTLESFEKFSDDFKRQYFGSDGNLGFEPSVEEIEGEYWRIVEKPTSEIEVLYGADLETKNFGSGFPKEEGPSAANSSETEDQYVKSGWNLNNFPKLPGSVLAFEGGDISGVLVPWLYVGMCFSSFCWHVEDHHLYSLNYMHFGAPKMWYGVSGNDASKLEASMRKNLPDLFEEQPDLLHNLVTQFSPSALKRDALSVCRCVQREGEFVLTLPRAYHAGFNTGFNCAEAVNVAPLDWLPHGQFAVELYREQGRKISVSHDKLLLGAAREAVRAQWELAFLKRNSAENLRWKAACGPNSVLARTLKARIAVERERRENRCNTTQPKKPDQHFDSTDRECSICHYDLHLSAASCPCNSDRFACLLHTKEMCKCDWSERVFIYRYEVSELEVLCDAVSGKLSAVHRWAVSDLRLSLSACVKKESGEKVKCESGVRNTESGEKRGKNTEVKCESGVRNAVLDVGCKEEKKKVLDETLNPKQNGTDMKCENLVKESKKEILPAVLLPFKETQKEISPAVQLKERTASNADVAPQNNELLPRTASNADVAPQNNPFKELLPVNQHQILPNSISVEAVKSENGMRPLNIQSANSEREVISNNREMVSVSNNNSKSVVVALSCTNDLKIKRNKNKGGPRVANVVRKFNCTVEILDYGVIMLGNKWSTSRAIFPKGYRSRVKYHSVIDPTQMCYYISEILDGGNLGPLFVVMVEECREEIFIHTSAIKCWEMVRERVNLEIRKQNIKGRADPTSNLLPPGSLDGLEMFGLTSPDIIKVVQAMDRDYACTEYWSSRHNNIQQKPTEALNLPTVVPNPNLLALKGLTEKANGEEMQALREILSSDASSKNRQEALLFLNKECGRF